ncbi:DUF3395 domain-containing protein [Akkermansiaceae bacterium]|nr:DUF3395 domain-containing protein [Akkermansiaceae bacterium]MDB4547023.1 DUF3395 domain-containing protein [Akkermansiaceae bacterium]MDB4725502.1 DUF3395 domain-containing protein [Akkermansiaceae bacterium]
MKIIQTTLFLLCTLVFAESSPLSDDYETLQKVREEKVREINKKYVEALKALKAKALKGEDLKLAVAMEKEIQRYITNSLADSGLYIISATYGNKKIRVDVTKALQGLVRNDKVDVNIKREFGDPAPGNGKYMSITYSINGLKRTEDFVGGDSRLRLPKK